MTDLRTWPRFHLFGVYNKGVLHELHLLIWASVWRDYRSTNGLKIMGVVLEDWSKVATVHWLFPVDGSGTRKLGVHTLLIDRSLVHF